MPTVDEHLKSKGVPFELIPHEEAYTSIDEARSLGIAADEVAKSVVLKTASGYALAVVPGTRRLDMKRVREAVGDKNARLASEDELHRDFADYELGALPPLGSLLGIPAYVDPEVMEHETLVFAAGSQTQSAKARTEDLFREERPTVTPLTTRPEPGEKEPLA